MQPIAKILTPFHEKFGVPRQSMLIPEAWGEMVFPKNDFYQEAFRDIEGFSHLWLIFEFHLIDSGMSKGLIRPPRFNSTKKTGVFASRSPFRLNRLGLSVVKFNRKEVSHKSIHLFVDGVDLVSGTPIYDIKPYLPYSDLIPNAFAHNFVESPQFKKVEWSCLPPQDNEKILIEKVIGLDPRPRFGSNNDETYGVTLNNKNILFNATHDGFVVTKVELLKNTSSPL